MEEEKTQSATNNLNEAPASATVKIKSKNGFEYLFTLRDEKASNLMFKIKAMEEKWLGLGWTPLAQNSFGKKPAAPVEYVQGRTCPQDGGRLIKPAPGSKAPIKCENNKYNFQTKQSYGCQYKEWQNAPEVPYITSDRTIPERQVNEDPIPEYNDGY